MSSTSLALMYRAGSLMSFPISVKCFFTAFDLRTLNMTQVIPPSTAFCFDDKVEFFFAFIQYHYGPVWVVGTKW